MKVARWGKSLAVRLPITTVKALELEAGDEVKIIVSRSRPEPSEQEREEAIKSLRKYRGRLPADFKFDREEAHSRR